MSVSAQIDRELGTEAERAFETAWRMIGGPASYRRNYRFSEERKLELDFAFSLPIGVGIEVNGGVWMDRGGHSWGPGLIRDYDKLRECNLCGYDLFYIPSDWYMVGDRVDVDRAEQELGPIRDFVLDRMGDR